MNIFNLNSYIKQIFILLLNICNNCTNNLQYIIRNDIPIYKYIVIKKLFGLNFAFILFYSYYLAWITLIYILYKLTINTYKNINKFSEKIKIKTFFNIIFNVTQLFLTFCILSLLYDY